MAEQMVSMTADQLQKLLEAVVVKMKEPTDAEKAQMEVERQALIRRQKEQAELARAQEQRSLIRRKNCPHHTVYNGKVFWKWGGQVHSDGLVHPVCNICHTEWPPFSAKLLPDEGKQGVGFETANPSKDQLTSLHKASFPKGCERARCFVCHPETANAA